MEGFSLGQQHADRLALQTCRITLLKKEQGGYPHHKEDPSEGNGAAKLAEHMGGVEHMVDDVVSQEDPDHATQALAAINTPPRLMTQPEADLRRYLHGALTPDHGDEVLPLAICPF